MVPWVPEVFSRVRRGASFRRPQAEDTSGEAARKNQNRKPRMKCLCHLGYPRAQMGFAEGLMGYWLRGHEGDRNKSFSKIQLADQKYLEKTT